MIPIVCFVGPSGVGKTTVVEQVARELRWRGLRVAAIKHARHDGFEIDHPGKDSWRFTQAGCNVVVLSSSNKMALIQERTTEATLEEIAPLLESQADIILAEGYKDSSHAKIEVFRPEVCNNLLSGPEELLAIVSDQRILPGIPHFGFAEIDSMTDFIIEHTVSDETRVIKTVPLSLVSVE